MFKINFKFIINIIINNILFKMDKPTIHQLGTTNFKNNNYYNRPKYLDEQQSKKLTYNFVTSKQLKRGHNFGVVYFTSDSLEEELQAVDNKKPIIVKTKKDKEREKIKKLEDDVVPPVHGRKHVSMSTMPVTTTIKPKPLTFNKSTQADEHRDRPQSVKKTLPPNSENKETQIEDGEIFNFDIEVEPILNVLTTKTLQLSRMEVLEEEEIEHIKKEQRRFEEARNRELMIVQKFEDVEKRKKEEIDRRVSQQKEKTDISKVYQKKLMSRVFAKEYLSRLKINSFNNLLGVSFEKQMEIKNRKTVKGSTSGIFYKPIYRDLQYKVAPDIINKVELRVKENKLFVNNISSIFENIRYNKIKKDHKESIDKEYKRREDEALRIKQEKERRKEEKRKKIEEEARKKKEKEREELKAKIVDSLLKNCEKAEDIAEVYDVEYSYIANNIKHASLSGGYEAQWALIVSALNKSGFDVDIDKLIKIFELFLPKFFPINIYINTNVFNQIKEVDSNIINIEDIIKSDDNKWNAYIDIIYNNQINNNMVLKSLFNKISNEYPDIYNGYKLVLESFFKAYTQIPEFDKYIKLISSVSNTIKLENNENNVDENNNNEIKNIETEKMHLEESPSYNAVFYLTHDEELKPKTTEGIAKKVAAKKTTKPIYEPDIYEKYPISLTSNDEYKILVFNPTFEKIIRHNIIECINKIYKIDIIEKDTFKTDLEEYYKNIENELHITIADEYKIDLFEYNLDHSGESINNIEDNKVNEDVNMQEEKLESN